MSLQQQIEQKFRLLVKEVLDKCLNYVKWSVDNSYWQKTVDWFLDESRVNAKLDADGCVTLRVVYSSGEDTSYSEVPIVCRTLKTAFEECGVPPGHVAFTTRSYKDYSWTVYEASFALKMPATDASLNFLGQVFDRVSEIDKIDRALESLKEELAVDLEKQRTLIESRVKALGAGSEDPWHKEISKLFAAHTREVGEIFKGGNRAQGPRPAFIPPSPGSE